MAIEDELVSCTTCAGIGMTSGKVCSDCRGRGIVRVSHAIVDLPEDDEAEEEPKPLENLSKAELVELAESLGLAKSGNRSELIERIQTGPLAPPEDDEAEEEPDVSDEATPEPAVDPEANAADATEAEEAGDAAPVDDGLDDLNVAQLRERLKDAGLDSTGKRDELLERLRA